MCNISFCISDDSFYGILVTHIYSLLKQRDVTFDAKSNWVLDEAMNIRKLHMSGTFQNALAKKVDEVVIPLFAKIIAIVDCNHNLGLLSSSETCFKDLWLKIFSKADLLKLNYEDIIGAKKVAVPDDNFECKLPFSWIIKESIDRQWETTKNVYGMYMYVLHN